MKAFKQFLALMLTFALLFGICGIAEDTEALPAQIEETLDPVEEEQFAAPAEEAPAEEEPAEQPVETLAEEPGAEASYESEQLNVDPCPIGEHEIDYDNPVYVDEYEHGYKCLKCGIIAEGENHVTYCNDPTKCVKCGGTAEDELMIHPQLENGSAQYTYADEQFHTWECPDCGKMLKGSHNVDCTQSEPYICQECNHEVEAAALAHDYGDYDYTIDDQYHWIECVRCGYKRDYEEHFAWCDELGVCGACRVPYSGPNVKHNISEDSWEYDATEHWIICEFCGEELERAEHEFENGVCLGCGYEQGEAITCESALRLTVKETYTLKPVSPSDTKFEFGTSDAKIASVSKTGGKITAKGVGTATITVTGKTSKLKASCTVTIIPAPTKVNIAPPSKTDYTTDDEPFALTASVEPANALQSVKWTSSDEKVALVSGDGLVSLVGQGKAKITATSEKKGTNGKKRSASVTIQVKDLHLPASISISEKASVPLYVNMGETLTLHAEMKPVTEGQTVISGVSWSIPMKQQKYATIDPQTGVLHAQNKEGSVTVTAKTDKKGGTGKTLKQLTDTVKITVVDPLKPRSVQINEGEKELPLYYEAGKTLALRATIEPATATPGVKWSIPNKNHRKIATIDAATGVVTPTGNKFGVVTVKVETTAKKSNKKAATATIKIAVVDPKLPYSVLITGEDGAELQDGVELKVGQALALSASIEPATATEKTALSWSIPKSQKKYATVDAKTGAVTGVKAGGSVTVTVKTANGKKDTLKIKIVQ